MSETLAELLRRSADAVSEPHFDVAELVAGADRRQRHRRLAVAAGAAGLVGAIVVGSLAYRSNPSSGPDPAPSPPPSPSPSVAVDPSPDGTRPLVYAAGSTVHVGEESFDAGGPVAFVDPTDDGVVFMVGNSERLWFHDGDSTDVIGRVPRDHHGYFDVFTASRGSLVVWADATTPSGRKPGEATGGFVVYDTSQRAVVGRLDQAGFADILHVDEGQVFFIPGGTPGCWLTYAEGCAKAHVLRYDVAADRVEKTTEAVYESELTTHARVLVLAEARGDTGTVFTSRLMARFNQVGGKLQPVDSNGDPTTVVRTTGEPVDLRAPAGYTATLDEMSLVQWLDDDRVVLWAAHESVGEVGPNRGDLLVCNLLRGSCRVAVAASATPNVPPGL